MRRSHIFTFFVLCVPAIANAQTTITLNGSGTGKIFQGLGGVSAGSASRLLIDYPEPYRSQILDYLFKPNYGASLQHLKVEIGGDVNSTDGAEPSHMHSATDQNYTRGYEWWLMQQAKLRNPNITLEALAWGAPGWIGNGNYFSQDGINYVLSFIQGAQSSYGLTIDEVGILNETSYNSNWIISLKAALQQAGLSTKVVAADQSGSNTTIVSDMVNIAALDSAVDIIGDHYTAGMGQPYSQPLRGQPVWDTEDGPWRGDWTGARYLARTYNLNYVNLKITLTEIWSLLTAYYDVLPIPGSGMMYANTPWSGNYNVQPAIWATAHTTQFAQPGWQYLDSASGNIQGGTFVTLKNGSDYSIIIETTTAGSSQNLTFNITGGLSTGTVHVWRTDSVTQFEQQSDIIPVNGSFTIALEPGAIYSLTTTTGQAKGNAVPPSASPFPLPYNDTFETYAPGQEAQYFSALNGSFETGACGGGRGGSCLRQAVSTAPIAWSEIGPLQPASILGATGWTNYEVSADVFLEQTGSVKLIGRFTGVNVNSGDVSAYQFYVGTGGWSLCHGNFVYLSSGTMSIAPNTWHTLHLIFKGTQIQGLIDGVVVTSVTDGGFANGMAGVGVQGWTNAQFDNFRVDLLPGAIQTVPQYLMTATATSAASGYQASNAIDGNSSTFWITAFSCVGGCMPTVPLPQSITLNLGGTYNVNTLTYLPRQDGNANGNITTYNIYASTDGVNFTNVATGVWAPDSTQKSASFTPTNASYVRLEAVAAGGGYAAASEINVDYTSSSSSGGNNPLPAVTALSPSSLPSGGAGFTLSVSGSNFVNGAMVEWNGADRPTTFAGSTSLTASITASDIATAGSAGISVFNPSPGGGTSNSLTFAITAGGGGGGGVGGGSGNAFVTAYGTAGRTARNDYSGWVGAKLTVASNALNVSSVGRVCLAGSSGAHTVKFVNAANGQDVAGGSASVSMAGCSAGQFVFASLPGTISLQAGASYYVVSQEVVGGDQWYDLGTVSTTSDAAVNSAVYSYNGNWVPNSSTNVSYVPPNFQYSLSVASLIPVTVGTNITGGSFLVDGTTYSSTETLNWPSGSSHTIAVVSPQSGGAGAQNVWSSWSDGGAVSHTIAPVNAATFTATFNTQYLLSATVSPAGSGTITAVPSSSTGYYASGTPVQLTAAPGTGSTFLNWGGDLSGSVNPQTLTMSAPHTVVANFQPPAGGQSGGTGSAFVTGYITAGRPMRNDYSGWVGAKLTVASNALNVGSVGRVCLAGNSGTHTVKFVNAVNGQDVAGGSVSVSMAGCGAGQFVFASLPGTISLQAGASYYLVSQEVAGGDQWYDLGAVSTTPDAAVNSAVYSYNGNWVPNSSANVSYVPPNFQYSLSVASLIPVTVGTNITGGSFLVDGTTYSSTETLNWPSGSSHTIAVVSPQSGGAGAQNVWSSWSDGGAVSHTIAPVNAATFTATFNTQYLLSATVSPAGSGTITAVPSSSTGYYASGTPVQLTAAPGTGSTFLNWGGDLSGSVNPQTLTMSAPHTVVANFQPPAGGQSGGTGSAFVTGYITAGRPMRNDYSGWVGAKLTVASNALNVGSVGRVCLAGNSGTHTVKFVNAVNGQDVAGGSASVSMAGCSAGQFVYVSLPGTINLPAGASYYLVSQEVAGGDTWYDLGTVSTTSDAAVNNAIYSYNGNWVSISSPDVSYVPPNFQYLVAPSN